MATSTNFPYSVTGLMDDARRDTGLSDFGGEAFREPLQKLLDDLAAEPHLRGPAIDRTVSSFATALRNRLLIQDSVLRQPEIRKVTIPKPLMVSGSGRSGTTVLHRLLAQDPAARAPAFWEQLTPAPPPDPATRDNDPRIKIAEELTRTQPNAVKVAHAQDAFEPDECRWQFSNSFVNHVWCTSTNLPSYIRWFWDTDMREPYQYYLLQLQILMLKCRGDHFVEKGTLLHMQALPLLIETFPDACIVIPHRDPLKSIASLCSLTAKIRGVRYEEHDKAQIGRFARDSIVHALDAMMADRERLPARYFFDVAYQDLVRDAVGTVRAIYEQFGYPFTPSFEAKIKGWLAENPQHKHGKHSYTLEEYGLDAKELADRTAPYRERYGVPLEAWT